VAGICKVGNDPLGSIKYGKFLDWLRTWDPFSFSRRTLLHGM